MISLLRLWTRNRPFSDFPQLSYDICDTARPYHDIVQLHSDIGNFVQPYSGISTTPRTHNMCYAALPHVWHHWPKCTICSTMLLTISPKNLDQSQCHTLLYMVSKFDFRVVHPLCALLSKILLVLWTFPVSCWCLTILFSYFSLSLCFLSVTNWLHFHFYHALFYHKTSCT